MVARDNSKSKSKTWHQKQKDNRTFGQRAADGVAKWMGSWSYIALVAIFIAVYIGGNMGLFRFDKYPFILLNLILGIFVLFGAPLIMMSQNRQSERDKLQAERDYANDQRALEIVEKLDVMIAGIETDKLDKIIEAVCPQEKELTEKKPKAAKRPAAKKGKKKLAAKTAAKKPKGEADG